MHRLDMFSSVLSDYYIILVYYYINIVLLNRFQNQFLILNGAVVTFWSN